MKFTEKKFNDLILKASPELQQDVSVFASFSNLKKSNVKNILNKNFELYCEGSNLSVERIAELTKHHTDIIESSDFQKLLDDPAISVQPMTGPVGLVIGINIVDDNICLEKTVVEAGSRYAHDPRFMDSLYIEMKARQKMRMEKYPDSKYGDHIVFCPYLLCAYSIDDKYGRGFMCRYGAVDHFYKDVESIENY